MADATAYGNRCAAAASTNGPRTEAEDCLFVNVQRPAGRTRGDRRPVYVFIHGGGLVNGSSNQADMAELAYLFPSFDNGVPIAPTFDAAERRLATDMKRYWGAFARFGTPNARGLAWWPRYDRAGESMSLRAGGESRLISDARFVTEHQCAFWTP